MGKIWNKDVTIVNYQFYFDKILANFTKELNCF